MKGIREDMFLDITGETCPITFVKTKLLLEQMRPGEILKVNLKAGEPLQNVPRSVKGEGHKVLKVESFDGQIYSLWIERGSE